MTASYIIPYPPKALTGKAHRVVLQQVRVALNTMPPPRNMGEAAEQAILRALRHGPLWSSPLSTERVWIMRGGVYCQEAEEEDELDEPESLEDLGQLDEVFEHELDEGLELDEAYELDGAHELDEAYELYLNELAGLDEIDELEESDELEEPDELDELEESDELYELEDSWPTFDVCIFAIPSHGCEGGRKRKIRPF